MPQRDDTPIRPAATVVVAREAQGAMSVLLVRRNSKLAFYGGAWVFPGGRIDAEDFAADPDDALTAARRAAARELREEAGLSVDHANLACFSRWVTPPGRPRRFDTWYFATHAPDARVQVDDGEVTAHRWMRPAEALQARAAGEIELPPPTFVTLSVLSQLGELQTAMGALHAMEPEHYLPRPCAVDGGTIYLYAGDAGYDRRDPGARGPRHRLTALGEHWRYQRD